MRKSNNKIKELETETKFTDLNKPEKIYEYSFYEKGQIKTKTRDKAEALSIKEKNSSWKMERYRVDNPEDYREKLTEFLRSRAKAQRKFKMDLLEEFGVKANPKSGGLFRFINAIRPTATDKEIRELFSELVELIK